MEVKCCCLKKNVTFTGWALPYPNNPSQFDYYRSGGSQKKKNRYSYYDCVTYHHLDYFYVTDNITQSTPNGIPIFNNLAQMYKKCDRHSAMDRKKSLKNKVNQRPNI